MRIILTLTATVGPFGNTAARWFRGLIKGLLAFGHQGVCFTVTDEPEEVVREAEQPLASTAGRGRPFRAGDSRDCVPAIRQMQGGDRGMFSRLGRLRAERFRWADVIPQNFGVYRTVLNGGRA